jgi:hypothetical protein
VHDSAISLLTEPRLQATHVPIRQAQPTSRFDLLQMTLFHLVQHFQSLSIFGTQLDSLRFHASSRPA